MRLVRPSVELLRLTEAPLELIEEAGRTCYKSEAKGEPEKFAAKILKLGHESVIEHASATFRIICDRGVTHEIVRHRIASYSQESTRYCDYNDGHMEFVIPAWCGLGPGIYPREADMPRGATDIAAEAGWFHSMHLAEAGYKRLRDMGWSPQQARSVLPNSLKTEIVMTANLREWRHFLKLRTASGAHPDMIVVANMIGEVLREKVPVLFQKEV